MTRDLVEQIESRMEILYPGDKEKIVKSTQGTLIRILLIICGVMAVCVRFGKINILSVFTAICMFWVLAKDSVYAEFDRAEIKLLKQLDSFIKDVSFHYRYDGNIEEAILDAARDSGYEMSLQAYKIYDSLINETMDTEIVQILPHHFLLTFYAICQTVKMYGDKKWEGSTVFLMNLSYLKRDVTIEILKREKSSALFLGLVPVTVLPLGAIMPLRLWGSRQVPGLAEYYEGVPGKLMVIFICVITVLLAGVIRRLKYPQEYDDRPSVLVKRVADNALVNRMVMRRIKKHYTYYYRQDVLLKSVVYRYNVRELMVCRGMSALAAGLAAFLLLSGVRLYESGKGGIWIMLLVIGMAMVAAGHYEIIWLNLRKRLLTMSREEEVVRFQSVMVILMNMDQVTLEVMLFWMEKFAVVFKRDIEELADSITFRGREAILKLKENANFQPFERILDCFLACEKVGISKACSEILSDRRYYVERHQQENEIMIGNKAMVAKLLAFLPLCMVILFVLILPFVYEGIVTLQGFHA